MPFDRYKSAGGSGSGMMDMFISFGISISFGASATGGSSDCSETLGTSGIAASVDKNSVVGLVVDVEIIQSRVRAINIV